MGYDLPEPGDRRICTHANALRAHPAFGQVVAVDSDAARRRTFENLYGGATYPTLREALGHHQPDVVVIATPTETHAEVVQVVLEHGAPKAILCEKPLAHEIKDAQRMIEACEARSVKLFVNYMRRSDPGVAVVKRMIECGEIAAPLKAVVWYSKGVIHNGSHFVNLMRHWLGPVEGVQIVQAGRRWEDRDPEPDFVARHQLGSCQFLAANEECFSHYTIEIVARNGRLRYEEGGERIEWQKVVDDADFAGYRILSKTPERLPADLGRYQWHVVEQLGRALRDESAQLCQASEGLETLRDIYRVIDLL
jgi:predicted dehydrogenase